MRVGDSVSSRSGGRILVDQLMVHGTDVVYCVPGESYLAALDAFIESDITLIVCRQEGGAAFMADADGHLTGRPGVCFVTRGPGFTNATAGLHTARQGSSPLVLLVGLEPLATSGREAFQEVDVERALPDTVKWAARIEDPSRLPEIMSRAFHRATSGRPGPVVVGVPEDVLSEEAVVDDAGAYHAVSPAATPSQVHAVLGLLAAAERPLLVVGGPGWHRSACEDLRAFAERERLPVATSFRSQDVFDNRHPNYAGHLGIPIHTELAEAVASADVLVAIGTRLDEISTAGYTLLDVPSPGQRLVHVHPDADELGVTYRSALPVNAAADSFIEEALRCQVLEDRPWGGRTDELNAYYRCHTEPGTPRGELDLAVVVGHVRDRLPADAIVTNGAGNYTSWVHRYHRYAAPGSQLAPRSGSMGYGLPAAIAAKIRHPERPVVAYAGDGCFLMTGQELATAVACDLDLLVIVVNNGMYGTIRWHQERFFPGRVIGTDLVNPDFADYARAFGAFGRAVDCHDDFAEALDEALAHPGPALIELRVDPEAITPDSTLRSIRTTP